MPPPPSPSGRNRSPPVVQNTILLRSPSSIGSPARATSVPPALLQAAGPAVSYERPGRAHRLGPHSMKPIVQISLDVTNIPEALATAEMALRAGVDWLEAGTPLIIAEGMNGVRALRERFPDVPIVADLKTMDGGYLEAELMAQAGATHVVVMARAHEETIKVVVQAGDDLHIEVIGDNLGCPDMDAGAERLEALGGHYVNP